MGKKEMQGAFFVGQHSCLRIGGEGVGFYSMVFTSPSLLDFLGSGKRFLQIPDFHEIEVKMREYKISFSDCLFDNLAKAEEFLSKLEKYLVPATSEVVPPAEFISLLNYLASEFRYHRPKGRYLWGMNKAQKALVDRLFALREKAQKAFGGKNEK